MNPNLQLNSLYNDWHETQSISCRDELFVEMAAWYEAALGLCLFIYKNQRNKFELSEDTTQKTYMKVFRIINKREKYLADIRQYFFSALKTNCLEELRKINVNRVVNIDDHLVYKLNGKSFDLEKKMIDKMTIDEIGLFLRNNAISAKDLEIFNLRVFEDLTYKDISLVKGISISVVKKKIYKVRDKLRKSYNGKKSTK